MSRLITAGSTDQSVEIRIVDASDGTPETGVTAATAGLSLSYRRDGANVVAIGSISDLASLNSAHTDGGIKHIGDGYYRLDVPDAAFAAGSPGVLIFGSATGMVIIGARCQLTAIDVNTSVGTAAAAAILASPSNKLATDGSGRVTVGSNADKTGYSLSTTPPTAAAIADAVWDEASSGHTTNGTFGKLLSDITSTNVGKWVWDALTSAHDVTDSFGKLVKGLSASAIATAVWEALLSSMTTPGTMGYFLASKLGLITSQGIVTASIVSSGDVIPIWQGRSREITFIIPTASINLSGHTPKFGMTKIVSTSGDASLEVVGSLTTVGTDYHLTFNLSTTQTATLAASPSPTHPFRVNTAEAYSYTWSISATDGAGSCPQLAEGWATVRKSDTTCSTS